MSIKALAISSFAKLMIGGDIFKKVKDIVIVYNDANLTGEQKRTNALKDIKDIGLDIGSWAINLALELAVAYFKSIA